MHVVLPTVAPALNSQVKYDTGDCSNSAPFTCFQFQAQVCMDAGPNPTSVALLKSMTIGSFFSADGQTALRPTSGGTDTASGACVTLVTPAGNSPPFPMASEGTPRSFMLVAEWTTVAVTVASVNQSACPTAAVIANVGPARQCAFRHVYELDYHF